jgi:RNA polymerase sigma-70 factor (ECF subfamily)
MVDFGDLCEQALPDVYRRARAKLPASDVDDVVQETFLAATKSFHRWRQDASFSTWIQGILRHKVADYYRRDARQPNVIGLDAIGVQPSTHDHRNQMTVRMVLATLPPRDRQVLALRHGGDMKFKHVAQALDISYEAAKSRYRRAATRFAEAWE